MRSTGHDGISGCVPDVNVAPCRRNSDIHDSFGGA